MHHAAADALPVLEALAGAGEKGLLTGTLTRMFTWPEDPGTRNRQLSSVLAGLRVTGRVRRSQDKERGTSYHGSFQWRWFITRGGEDFLAAAMRPQRARQQDTPPAGSAAAALRAAQSAWVLRSPSRQERDAEIIRLSAAGCSYASIAALFGLSRERARQVAQAAGHPPRRARTSPGGGDGNQAR